MWSISAKGLLVRGRQILLMANERNEWELPGGHIESGETPEQAVVREWQEETGLLVTPTRLLDAAFYEPHPEIKVFLVFYRLEESDPALAVHISDEHEAILWAPMGRLPSNLPAVYQRAISKMTTGTADLVLHTAERRLARESVNRVERLGTAQNVKPVIGIGGAADGQH